MVKKIAFTMYPVKDMARARRFYEEGLGLEMSSSFQGIWVEYDPPGGCFAITTLASGVRPSSDAGGVIAFEVEDVDALAAELCKKGATLKVEPFSTPVCRMAILVDPEGNGFVLHKVTD